SFRPGDRSTTANFCGLVSRRSPSSLWATIAPPMRIGITTRLMMKPLVRTVAKYSRTAMTSVLRMLESLHEGPTVLKVRIRHMLRGSGDAHKNIVERRLGQLEVTDPAAGNQGGEKALGICALLQPQFLP